MGRDRKRRRFGAALCGMMWLLCVPAVCAQETGGRTQESRLQTASESGGDDALLESYLRELDLADIEKSIQDMLPQTEFHFRESVRKLVRGEIPLNAGSIKQLAMDTLFAELNRQKKIVVQILVLAVAAAVFTNFVQIFHKNQISEIAFYMIYLLLFVLLMKAFRELSLLTGETLGEILHFMRLLLPVYLAVATLAAGSLTAVGFYELTLFFITAVQSAVNYIVLPGISFYVLFLLLNHLSREDYLSKLADLLHTALSWLMKTLLALVIGVQTIQSILLPAIDALKNSVWRRAGGAVPVLGNTWNAVTETVLGTAVLLKNAVGVAGLLAILLICLVPAMRLLVCTFLYKLLGAGVQPVSDRRITECISGLGEGVGLLLQVMGITSVMFLLTLAMVTASIRA